MALELPCRITIKWDDGVMLKPGAFTRSATVAVAVKVPETPVMVRPYDPRLAEPLAVSVSTLSPVAGFVLHAEETLLGKPETERLTSPVNPPSFCTVIVVGAEAPGSMVRLAGEAMS